LAEIKCIDVSEWQGNIDFDKVKKSGITSVILRAGFGRESSQRDSEFEKNYRNAKSAGLKAGVYWYSYAVDVNDAKKEAQACLEVIKGKEFELPVFYDMEDSSQTGFGKSLLTDMAESFCNTVKNAGFSVGVYANLNWFENHLDYSALKKKYFIWLAQYHTEAQLNCDIWQYSSSGKVSGIEGNVDMNVIYNEDVFASDSQDTSQKDIIKKGDRGLGVLCLKYILKAASDLGGVSFDMTMGNDVFGEGTEKAVKATQKSFGMSQSGTCDKAFADKLYADIKSRYPLRGDINDDGKVNVRDVTALQRNIAGDTDV